MRLPAALRAYAGGAARLEVEGSTVGDVLAALDRSWPAVGRRVLDEQGQLRRHVHVYVGEDRMASQDHPVAPGAEITILPAVSGGAVSGGAGAGSSGSRTCVLHATAW